MYKSQLQEHAQKCGWTVPQYESSMELRFQASVEVNGVKYDSDKSKHFSNLKAAEHSAAKRALDALTGGAPDISLVRLSWFFSCLPLSYGFVSLFLGSKEWTLSKCAPRARSKEWLASTALPAGFRMESKGLIQFVATVEIDVAFYKGGVMKNKKEAEVKAARTAVLAIEGTGDAVPPPEEYIPLQSGEKRMRAAKNEEESLRSKAQA